MLWGRVIDLACVAALLLVGGLVLAHERTCALLRGWGMCLEGGYTS